MEAANRRHAKGRRDGQEQQGRGKTGAGESVPWGALGLDGEGADVQASDGFSTKGATTFAYAYEPSLGTAWSLHFYNPSTVQVDGIDMHLLLRCVAVGFGLPRLPSYFKLPSPWD